MSGGEEVPSVLSLKGQTKKTDKDFTSKCLDSLKAFMSVTKLNRNIPKKATQAYHADTISTYFSRKFTSGIRNEQEEKIDYTVSGSSLPST